MICVDTAKFAMRKVFSDSTLKEFCEMCDPPADFRSIFLEGDSWGDETQFDVMLVDKVCQPSIVLSN